MSGSVCSFGCVRRAYGSRCVRNTWPRLVGNTRRQVRFNKLNRCRSHRGNQGEARLAAAVRVGAFRRHDARRVYSIKRRVSQHSRCSWLCVGRVSISPSDAKLTHQLASLTHRGCKTDAWSMQD
eukprot:6187336-Pleurochrysis_carterae.AAC.1